MRRGAAGGPLPNPAQEGVGEGGKNTFLLHPPRFCDGGPGNQTHKRQVNERKTTVGLRVRCACMWEKHSGE